jgi:acetyltransferase-like isoleucine patch superfamily enzyme
MNKFFKALNRGPVFRLTLAIEDWGRRRRFGNWRRRDNSSSSIDPGVMVAGNPNALAWIKIGPGTELQRLCRISIGEEDSLEPRLTIGSRVFIGQGAHLSVMRPMTIGDNAIIGANSYLLTNQHRFESREIPMRDQGYKCEPLVVGEDVWIGANCVIMPGIEIGRGAIIGAGSVLTETVGPYEIWGGIPARKIGVRP